jgi:hypothetical protein
MISELPELEKLAVPETTVPPDGLAWAVDVKHDATARASALAFQGFHCGFCRFASTAPHLKSNLRGWHA